MAASQEGIQALTARIKELEQRLNRDSTNADQPPSSDSPYRKPKNRGDKKRKSSKKNRPR
ncbi:MAG: DUF6444 domain-containing protein [Thermodesulfobacteriota bacterium]|uniref:DUF6444 domain-containing protein n=1 Tax=Desulfoglaeba alkanexedens TaxID=361111 RepID=UPI0024829164|nr:DUF6444 domain-containing protein [Desulfoglaeba alkanexedens]MDY6910534.1 DUF6444 domain-containing protein [Thermodesulfobacteriota bacterium]